MQFTEIKHTIPAFLFPVPECIFLAAEIFVLNFMNNIFQLVELNC